MIRHWLAFGSGAGIEIRRHDLDLAVARVRPSGVREVARTTIAGYDTRPAAEWGAECSSFLRKAGASPLAAIIVLPRRETTVRVLHFPGVAAEDLGNAIGYQVDSLHPYPENDAVHAWARLGDTPYVLVCVARASALSDYATLFAEAGVRVAGFTCSAAVLYAALRIARPAPPSFVASQPAEAGMEMYGESPARPVFSTLVEEETPRTRSLALSELRLEESPEVALPALSQAAAIVSACPRLALPLNLLPQEQRSATSRLIWAPTAALAVLLLAASTVLFSWDGYEDRRFLVALEAEIAKISPLATRGAALERSIENTRARIALLDEFRTRPHADLNSLNELTRLLAPPAWLQNLALTRTNLTMQGEAEQAAALLKLLDASPLFRDTEFAQPISRSANGENFGLRANREGGLP